MKVSTNTPDLLIVDDRPWIMGVFMAACTLAFAGAGVVLLMEGNWKGIFAIPGAAFFMLFFFIFIRRTQAVFHGREGWVEIRSQTLLGYRKIRHELTEIERAIVETSSGGDGGGTHRVALVIPKGQSKGRHPLTPVYTSGEGARRAVSAINGWLDSHRSST